jgi:hypothetical protein
MQVEKRWYEEGENDTTYIEEGTRRVTWGKPMENKKRQVYAVYMKEDAGDRATIADTGAEVPVVNLKTAEDMEEKGIAIYEPADKETSKEYIVFAKSEHKAQIVGWIRGNGLMEEVAVVEDIDCNLIGINTFTKRGMSVIFDSEKVEIKYGDRLLTVGRYDQSLSMWTMDIEWMMRAPHPAIMKRSTRETNDKRVYTMRMRPRWKAEDIRLAREFHSNTLHVPYNTAAKMIEDEVWTDIDERITPALLRHIGARRDCLICATTRWNQQPHFEKMYGIHCNNGYGHWIYRSIRGHRQEGSGRCHASMDRDNDVVRMEGTGG